MRAHHAKEPAQEEEAARAVERRLIKWAIANEDWAYSLALICEAHTWWPLEAADLEADEAHAILPGEDWTRLQAWIGAAFFSQPWVDPPHCDNVVDDFLARATAGESPAERRRLLALRDAAPGLYQVLAADADGEVVLADMMRGRPIHARVNARDAGAFASGDCLACWLMEGDDGKLLIGASLGFVDDIFEKVVDAVETGVHETMSAAADPLGGIDVRSARRAADLQVSIAAASVWLYFAILSRRGPVPGLRNPVGDRLMFAEVRWPVMRTVDRKVPTPRCQSWCTTPEEIESGIKWSIVREIDGCGDFDRPAKGCDDHSAPTPPPIEWTWLPESGGARPVHVGDRVSDERGARTRDDTVVDLPIEPSVSPAHGYQSLCGDVLLLKTDSEARAQQAVDKLRYELGDLVGPHEMTVVDPWELGACNATPPSDGEPSARPDGRLLEEYRTLYADELAKLTSRHWPDLPLSAFNGATPRQRARTAEGRREVRELIRALEDTERRSARAEGRRPFRFRCIRKELGLIPDAIGRLEPFKKPET